MITLRQKMIEEMDLHGYAMQTKRNYLASVLYLVRFANTTPGRITQEQIKQFLHFKQRAGLAPSSLRNLFAGIRSFATHLYEAGVPLVVIQKLLGHARIETTTKYTWIANSTVSSIKSPLDLIIIPKSHKEADNA